MNSNNQKTVIAGDDLLWVQYDVAWKPVDPKGDDAGTVQGLIKSPTNFIAAHDIKVIDEGVPVTPTVPIRFVLLFKSIQFGDPSPVGVQGIDKSSILTVLASKSMGSGHNLLPKIPLASPILVTMVESCQQAYIHWEVSAEGPGHVTTPTELVNHMEATLLHPEGYEEEYARRLAVPRINAQVMFVDNNGDPIDPQPDPVAIQVQYQNGRSVLMESDDIGLLGDPRPYIGVVSCNVDIGQYYINPETNSIVIVVNSTIVKVY